MNNNTFLLTNTDHLTQEKNYVIIDFANKKNIFYFISGKSRTWQNGKKFITKVIIHFYFIIGNIMVLHNGEKFTTKNNSQNTPFLFYYRRQFGGA